ncbi:BREX-1 system adenine-specific DNA-methyltransferase PglX [Xenorhabdus doucetiae]|uniref:site-specific DNA-methyltransferase (adenine-specific) n=1 Tax=Xenorhabdus doucetiae TaxID=351671 RepID=A0A068QM08_9GAMM|nr:BREX-1 system adenine-specific DNA-methyltransferase PglX [Xenorhabdus doucetiae]TYP01951.1 type II restriction/modification system DNA methylase subunit YeeA [Xenorhabdus doucetiae]CDG15738.1 Type II restriction enzyme [Xenorhabdus doucetiae]
MNTSNIKKYAPLARTQFCNAIAQKLTSLGIHVDKKGQLQITDATEVGDQVHFGSFAHPKTVLTRRHYLVERAHVMGYMQLVEHVAHTWFNRLCALRYMELHGYLDHGFRVLSNPNDALGFEVLEHVPEVATSLGLKNTQQLVEMKLAGDQDEALYRELLLGQCHFLHKAMPFLFDSLNDETELLLPDNLMRTDSILRGLVDSIPEEDWEQVEVIGWLYQFYISEKKDLVMGKVVKSEDIPAATQLFTPNWIVQYLVQNSVGRQWLQTYPDSPLKQSMPYYIEPAEQTPEVQAQWAAITPDSIEPESIKVLDPACGSGHILIEAYNVLKRIYEERGYRSRDIPQLILENNIFGLDIDDRAAQLSGFALLMMARQDDRRIFTRDIRLNVLSLQESAQLDIPALWQALNLDQQSSTGNTVDMFAQDVVSTENHSEEYQLLLRTLALFTQAKTLGSLIQVPQQDSEALYAFLQQLIELENNGDTHQKEAVHVIIPFIHQAWLLAQRYDSVVANPPYMGGKGMNRELKEFAKKQFPDSKSDLFAMFMQHAFSLLKANGFNAQVNMQSWMFLSSYEKLREWLLDTKTFVTMAHLGARAFGQISGEVVQTTAWVLNKHHADGYQPVFFRLIDGNEEEKCTALKEQYQRFDNTKQGDFKKISGAPIAYWVSEDIVHVFEQNVPFSEFGETLQGMTTCDNDFYLRYWYEVCFEKINFESVDRKAAYKSASKWFPYTKGGAIRKWYGNNEYVVNWERDGELLRTRKHPTQDKIWAHNFNLDHIFNSGITYSSLSSGSFSCRFIPNGYLFDQKGSMVFVPNHLTLSTMSFLNSSFCKDIVNLLCPTLDFNPGSLLKIPTKKKLLSDDLLKSFCNDLITLSKFDWDSYEESWEFKKNPVLSFNCNRLKISIEEYFKQNEKISNDMKHIEEEINKIVNDIYNVSNSMPFEVSLSNVTVKRNLLFRYSELLGLDDKKNRNQSDTLAELLSYAIGCMMGRYSLDREGLVYAHAGNKGFAELVEQGAYKTFPADNDGILPLMDSDWFDDDITTRVREFVRTVWGEEHLQENLDFIAESLCLYAIKPKKGESALDTIRRYLSTQFWKDHMKMYKKRPIYWLFSSGKEKAFECLVYLHRYNDATLARIRTEYVVPLLARYQSNIDRLQKQRDNASSTAEANRLKKEQEGLSKKFNELRGFDDRLRHYADTRITIDLDDGVKVNYGKFGNLLADVKAITGNKAQEE